MGAVRETRRGRRSPGDRQPARGDPGVLHAAADAPPPAWSGGRCAGRGAGLAGGESFGARGGRGHRGSAGAVARRGDWDHAAGGRGPRADPDPPGRLDLSRDHGPAAGPGRRHGGVGADGADHDDQQNSDPNGSPRLRHARHSAGRDRRRRDGRAGLRRAGRQDCALGARLGDRSHAGEDAGVTAPSGQRRHFGLRTAAAR